MSQSTASVLVLHGDGINCERETARAFAQEGGKVDLLHVNEFLKKPEVLLQYSVLAIPGGFSFGDELRSGKILAEKMRVSLAPTLKKYLDQGGLALGVCNGFQVLIQLGVFEPSDSSHDSRTMTLATNDHGQFLDFWTTVEITSDAALSPWFQGMGGKLNLPIRHKEGRIVIKGSGSRAEHERNYKVPLKYVDPVNGSYDRGAALLDSTGQILGLMPHPEAATQSFLNPSAHLSSGISAEENALQVRKLFQNALQPRVRKES